MLKNLKSLFIVDDDAAAADKKAAASAKGQQAASSGAAGKRSASGGASATSSTAASQPPPVRPGAQASAKMTERLLQAIDDANLDGFDYLEYKRAVKGLQKFSMDEATQFRSAFTTASTIGATLPTLVSSAEHYLHVLDAERDKFDAAFKMEYGRKVTQAESDVKRLRQEITDKAEAIKRLQAEIEQRQGEVAKLEQGAQSVRNKVLATRDSFQASFEHVRGVITADIERMRRYLQ